MTGDRESQSAAPAKKSRKSNKKASVSRDKKPLIPESGGAKSIVKPTAAPTRKKNPPGPAPSVSEKPVSNQASAKNKRPTTGSAPGKTVEKTLAEGIAPLMTGADFGMMAENMAELIDQGRKALAVAIGGVDAGDTRSELAASVADATRTLGHVAEYWLAKPDRAALAQAELYGGLSEIWRQTMMRYAGEDAPPVIPQDPADKRFASAEWRDIPFFDWLRQSYLFTTRWAGDLIDKTEGLDPQMRNKAAFYTRLLSSAVSPSNFVPTNPELLRATVEAKGENLVRGLRMLAEDISAGHGMLKIRQTSDQKFELGVNMATTPGKVVWRNDVMELIQYAPATEEVYARPLLITPPWINKFYVLDLNAEKSFVRWAVEQGLTVFIISWVNPDESKAEKVFDAYMHEGVLTALDVI
jgi:polyhydroxyalkanoate synthase